MKQLVDSCLIKEYLCGHDENNYMSNLQNYFLTFDRSNYTDTATVGNPKPTAL